MPQDAAISSSEKTPIELWLEALEKGHYFENRNIALRTHSIDPQIIGYEYSVVGVLCDLFLEHSSIAKNIDAKWNDEEFSWREVRKIKTEKSSIPAPVMLWLGIKENAKIIELTLRYVLIGRILRFEALAVIITSLK